MNGAVRAEIAERRVVAGTGLDETAWQRASDPYLRRMLATGRFPVLAEVVIDAAHPAPDVAFDRARHRRSTGSRSGSREDRSSTAMTAAAGQQEPADQRYAPT